MTWTGKGGVRFIRPIRWIVALLDDQVISVRGCEREIREHDPRTSHSRIEKPALPVTVGTYEQVLRDNFVMREGGRAPDPYRSGSWERCSSRCGAVGHAHLLHGVALRHSRQLRSEAILQLPREILSTVMRHHQRYFSVMKPDGSLAPEFVAVTNTDGDPDGLIRRGNERVLRARFNDARFFWEVDQRRTLSERLPDLDKVTFQAKLGSYGEKAKRMECARG